MHHTITTAGTDPLTLTLSAHAHPRHTPGWITTNTITFPRVGTPAPTADSLTISDLGQTVSLLLATADRMGDLAARLARLERQAKAGEISPNSAARRLRRILGALDRALETLTTAA